MESQECTFLPAILDTPTVDEEARAALPVWERLQLAGAEIEARREHRRMLAAEQERAKSPFTPAILGACVGLVLGCVYVDDERHLWP